MFSDPNYNIIIRSVTIVTVSVIAAGLLLLFLYRLICWYEDNRQQDPNYRYRLTRKIKKSKRRKPKWQ